jgi:hypothetical protein
VRCADRNTKFSYAFHCSHIDDKESIAGTRYIASLQ